MIRFSKMLLLATAVFSAVSLSGCNPNSGEDNPEGGSSPKFVNAVPGGGDEVAVDLAKIEIRYDSPIQIVDNSLVTLTSDGGEVVKTTVVAQNVVLAVTLNATLDYESSYTLKIANGAIASKSDSKALAESFSMTVKTAKKPFVPDPDADFVIDEKLINPNAGAEAVALYDYLREGFGVRTLSGAMAKYTVQMDEAEWIEETTGQCPALFCYDFMNCTRDYSWDVPYSDMITSAKEWTDKGGVIAAMWHWRDPRHKDDGFYSMNTSADNVRTDFDISKIHDTSSEEYKGMVADIDVVAGYLSELQDLGIAVLWRPLHEAQGAWFWWGAGSAEDTKALWDLLYDRLVNYHKLNNLIWVWTVDKKSGAEDWYPGDDKVDILGTDIYGTPSHASRRDYFDFVATIGSHTKLVALSECGAIPDPDNMVEGGDTWSWFMPWIGDFLHDDKYNGADYLKKVMNNDFVTNRDDRS